MTCYHRRTYCPADDATSEFAQWHFTLTRQGHTLLWLWSAHKVNRVAFGQPPGTCTLAVLYKPSKPDFFHWNSEKTTEISSIFIRDRDNNTNRTCCCNTLIRYCWNYTIIDIMTCWVRNSHANDADGSAIYGLSDTYCVLPRWDTVLKPICMSAGITACNKVDQTRSLPHIDCRNTQCENFSFLTDLRGWSYYGYIWWASYEILHCGSHNSLSLYWMCGATWLHVGVGFRVFRCCKMIFLNR